jgi:predicted glutamine amidotransferase
MCGITYVQRETNLKASKMTYKRFEKQRHRGTQGFGFVGIEKRDDGKFYIETLERSENEKGIKQKLDNAKAPIILFHHRYPTSTENIEEATHPIFVSHLGLLEYDYYVVHNGVITNCDELKKSHEEMGFEYTTKITTRVITETRENIYEKATEKFNDSEAMAIDLALTIEGKQTAMRSFGNIATVAIAFDRETKEVKKLYFGRNIGNPLVWEKQKEAFVLSSEGQGDIVPMNILHEYDYVTGETKTKVFEFGKTYSYKREEPETKKYEKGYYNSGQQSMGFLGKKQEIEDEDEYDGLAYDDLSDESYDMIYKDAFPYKDVTSVTESQYCEMFEEYYKLISSYEANANPKEMKKLRSIIDLLNDKLALIETSEVFNTYDISPYYTERWTLEDYENMEIEEYNKGFQKEEEIDKEVKSIIDLPVKEEEFKPVKDRFETQLTEITRNKMIDGDNDEVDF